MSAELYSFLSPSGIDPNEDLVVCVVPDRLVQQSYRTGTLYSDFEIGDRCLVSGDGGANTVTGDSISFGQYVLCGKSRELSPKGAIAFCFGKPKTSDEMVRPFRSTPLSRPHPWPPMVHKIALIKLQGLPHAMPVSDGAGNVGTAFAHRYLARAKVTNGADEGSLFITDEFLSPTPFIIPQLEAPQPQPIITSFMGVEINLGPSLHPRLRLGPVQAGTSVVFSTGESVTGSSVKSQTFEPTNFTEWEPYVLTDDQTFDQSLGLWRRTRVTVHPPIPPAPSVKNL